MFARYGGAFGTSMALHAAVAAWLAWTTFVPPLAAQQQPERRVEVVLLPPAEDSAFPGLKPVERSRAEGRGDLKGEGEIAGADIERIGGHLLVLFPFVRPGLALDAFFPSVQPPSRLVFDNPYVKPPPAPEQTQGRRLTLNAAALQALVDTSWTRARRWKAFDAIRRLILDGDPQDPALATLIALYRDQNALQPYADGSVRDLRLWAQLGLAADHVDFIGFIRGYASAHPSTKATTELLFLLDTLAQANADALAVLVETDQPGDLEWTKATHPRAYLLARDIKRYYAHDIVRLGLTTRPAVDAFYDRGRLSILMRILETTPKGYRADDARFLIGEILWNEGRADDALRVWREMTAGPSDATYAVAIAQLRTAVQPAKPDARNIRYILRNQQGRWLSASDDRLRRFGYRADVY
jgi:hypothetical protein